MLQRKPPTEAGLRKRAKGLLVERFGYQYGAAKALVARCNMDQVRAVHYAARMSPDIGQALVSIVEDQVAGIPRPVLRRAKPKTTRPVSAEMQGRLF